MDKKVQKAIHAALAAYNEQLSLGSTDFGKVVEKIFISDQAFTDKLSDLDAAFDDAPRYEDLREVFFDLLLVNFFSKDVKKLEEDYLESPEWEQIEDETIDRGTELLNVLLYLKECEDEDIEPSLGDFLQEFLLVDEDEFQDEHRIYEDLIANQILIESDPAELAKVSAKLPDSSEMKELFYPVMGFFQGAEPAELVEHSTNKAFDAAVCQLLMHY